MHIIDHFYVAKGFKLFSQIILFVCDFTFEGYSSITQNHYTSQLFTEMSSGDSVEELLQCLLCCVEVFVNHVN